MAFKMKYGKGSFPFKKTNDKNKNPRYKQGELKKGFGEGKRTNIAMTMEQAVEQAKEQNRLAEIKRMKEDGFYWDEASGTFKEMD